MVVGNYTLPVLLGSSLFIYAANKKDASLIAISLALMTFKPHIGFFMALAAKDATRGSLFKSLDKAKRLDKFPAKYKTQLDIARSYLLADKNYASIDSVVFISKQLVDYNQKKGTVYFFKYRVKKADDWKIGISGLQPENLKEVGSNDKLCFMTDKKIKEDKPLNEQFQDLLKKILFSTHKSAKNFYETDGNAYNYKKIDAYED